MSRRASSPGSSRSTSGRIKPTAPRTLTVFQANAITPKYPRRRGHPRPKRQRFRRWPARNVGHAILAPFDIISRSQAGRPFGSGASPCLPPASRLLALPLGRGRGFCLRRSWSRTYRRDRPRHRRAPPPDRAAYRSREEELSVRARSTSLAQSPAPLPPVSTRARIPAQFCRARGGVHPRRAPPDCLPQSRGWGSPRSSGEHHMLVATKGVQIHSGLDWPGQLPRRRTAAVDRRLEVMMSELIRVLIGKFQRADGGPGHRRTVSPASRPEEGSTKTSSPVRLRFPPGFAHVRLHQPFRDAQSQPKPLVRLAPVRSLW